MQKSLDEITEVLMRETVGILKIEASWVTRQIPLANLGFDSLTFQELLIVIEKNFAIKYLDGLEPEDMLTLESMSRWIERVS